MALNGHSLAPDEPANPRADVARGLYETQLEEGDPPFDELEPEEAAALLDYAAAAIGFHAKWLTENGFRIVPPGMCQVPQSADEAKAMLQACREFNAAQKRKKTLLTNVAPRKLILPPGMH